MAGIYIKGMEMPTSCFYCPLSVLNGERLFCEITKDEVVRAKKASGCPLVLVPPHGDLVDAQEILKILQVAAFSTYEDYEEAYDTVDFAETVIPADKESKDAKE